MKSGAKLKRAFVVEIETDGPSYDLAVRIRGDEAGCKIEYENRGETTLEARFGHDVVVDDPRHNANVLVPLEKEQHVTLAPARRDSMHDCPDCVCGKIEFSWSDRVCHVLPGDMDGVANVVVSCALDHSYDRPTRLVPWGISDEHAACLAPIVEKHLSAVNAKWRDETTYDMTDEQRAAFKTEIKAALEAAYRETA